MLSAMPVASMPATSFQDPVAALTDYVAAPDFPCVGARSAFNKQRARFGRYGELGSDADVAAVCSDLRRFSAEFPHPGTDPVTFIAVFESVPMTEPEFARRMWSQLQAMHAHDSRSFDWAADVSADPAEPDFSFSVGERAFFVVGLHPAASRFARRAPVPCLVFNFHDQFESLRASGKYAGLQKVIRSRDIELQGSINPVLDAFGDRSEARQYSGVSVGESWQCPFHAMESAVER
jgi:uncharacterized protein